MNNHSVFNQRRATIFGAAAGQSGGSGVISEPQEKPSFWRSPSGRALGIAAGSLVLTGLGAFVYATMVETRLYRLETIDITTGGAARKKSDNGHSPRRQLKILHLSDLHLHGDDDEKASFLHNVTDDDYDIVVLTGDIFEKYSGIKYSASLLARKPRIGAFAVLGNHDHYDYNWLDKTFGRLSKRLRRGTKRNVQPMVTALQEVGYTVFRNQSLSLPEHELFVVGIDWPTISEDQLQQLVAPAPAEYFRLCLFHLPAHLDNMRRAGFDVAVGGHTHGGQIRIPGFGPIVTDSELGRHEASGLIWRGQTAFHVSRGLGADPRSNIRFFCPPAATVLKVTHYE
jgi:predicted MPP superfamily phosphohydrolase